MQAENLSAYLDKGYKLPRIVVLVDGFQNLGPILGTVRPMEFGPLDWFGEFQRIVTDGRQLGIHVILTVDRRQAVPALMMSAIGNRLVLRQTDEGGYLDYGVPSALARGLELPSGRGLWNDQLVQIGLVSDEPSAAAQGAAIAAIGASQSGRVPVELRTEPPPDEVRVPLVASAADRFTLGRTDVFGGIVEVSVEHTGLCVAGPPRSGRTTTLRHVARSLIAAGYEVWTVGLGDDIGGPGRHAIGKIDPTLELLEDFAALCESLPKPRPYILVVDNVDRYDESAFANAYDRVLKTETSRLIGAIETRNLSRLHPEHDAQRDPPRAEHGAAAAGVVVRRAAVHRRASAAATRVQAHGRARRAHRPPSTATDPGGDRRRVAPAPRVRRLPHRPVQRRDDGLEAGGVLGVMVLGEERAGQQSAGDQLFG